MGGKERNASELRKVHYNLSPCCSRFQGNLNFVHFTSKLYKVGTEIERQGLCTFRLVVLRIKLIVFDVLVPVAFMVS